MKAHYAELTKNFYASFWYGIDTLVLPTVTAALLVAVGLAALAIAAKSRISFVQTFSFIFAFALVGCVTGVVAGWTLETIVGAALAAVLGIVSSLLTFLFGKQTLRLWRPVIPLAIAALMASTLLGMVVGGSRRSQVIEGNEKRASLKFEDEQVYVPVERERRLELVKRCIAESPNAAEAADC